MIHTIDRKPLPLWPGAVPFSLGNEEKDIPTITPFVPPLWKMNRKAIVIFPGGGYGCLAPYEGEGYAEYFAQQGFFCFVVKYRLGRDHGYHHPVQISDAARAVRFVRSLAPDLGIRPECVGVMGSSAGGHLAASVATLPQLARTGEGEGEVAALSSRPSFSILCYPVITMEEPFTHKGSREALLGADFSAEDAQRLSLEKSVTSETSPTFLFHKLGDIAVPIENSLLYAGALRKHGVRFELHIYECGNHGGGLDSGHQWAAESIRWMNTF